MRAILVLVLFCGIRWVRWVHMYLSACHSVFNRCGIPKSRLYSLDYPTNSGICCFKSNSVQKYLLAHIPPGDSAARYGLFMSFFTFGEYTCSWLRAAVCLTGVLTGRLKPCNNVDLWAQFWIGPTCLAIWQMKTQTWVHRKCKFEALDLHLQLCTHVLNLVFSTSQEQSWNRDCSCRKKQVLRSNLCENLGKYLACM